MLEKNDMNGLLATKGVMSVGFIGAT